MEILICTAYACLGLFIIQKVRFFSDTPLQVQAVQFLYLVKLFAGISVGLIYTYYYTDRATADVYKYFDDGRVIFSAFKDNPLDYFRMLTGIDSANPCLEKYYVQTNFWFKEFDYRLFNDNRTIIRFNAFLFMFSGGYFFVHSIIMASLSFVGTFCIFKAIYRYAKTPIFIQVATVFLLPSFLFWSSGLLKEGLLIFGTGSLLYSAETLKRQGKTVQLIGSIVFALAVLSLTKYYVLACLVPALIVLLLSNETKYSAVKNFTIVHVGLIAVATLNWAYPVAINIFETLAFKRNDYIKFANSLDSVGSRIDMQPIAPNIISFIGHIPEALYNSIFLPMPWNISSALSVLPFIENIILFAFVFLALIYRKKDGIKPEMFAFCLSFSLLLFTLSGLITPVIGSLVRYKMPALPFLFFMLAAIIDWSRILSVKFIEKVDRILCETKT